LIIASLLLLPLGSITYSIQPIIVQRAIDNLPSLWTYVAVLLAVVLLNFVLQILQFYLINKVGQGIVSDMRQKLFMHMEKLPLSFFDRTPVGRSVSRLTSDIEQLSESFAGGLILVLLDIVNIMGILAFMFYLNTKLTLIILAFLIPVFILSNFYQEKFQTANLQARVELSKLNSFLHQNIIGIKVVQIHNALNWTNQRFADINQKYFKANDESIKSDAQLSALIEMISLLAILVLIFICSKFFSDLVVSAGLIIAFIQYSQSLFEPIRNLTDRFTVIQSAFTALARIEEVFGENTELYLEGDLIESHKNHIEPVISFENVSFRYKPDSNWVLRDFNLKVFAGEKIGIVGRTGQGKSTLIKILTGMYQIENGSIKIYGKNINEISKKDLREKISVIHQDSYIFAGDLFENIYLNRNIDPDLNIQKLHELLSEAQIDHKTELSERAANISSGQQQMINFLRVYVSDPLIVVLDEASSRIDESTESVMHKYLNAKFKDKTMILIAHRTKTLNECDRIIDLSLKN
jgi:ATP-binding cassette subfamily B protein